MRETACKYLNDLGELAAGARVCLYGAGLGGANFRRLLASERPDVQVVAFVDDAKEGEKDGVPVIGPERLASGFEGCDQVLVTSAWWREIRRKLLERGIRNHRVVNPRLYFPEHVFAAGEEESLAPRIARVRSLLASPADRALYDLLLANRREDSAAVGDPLAFFARSVPRPREYLDFIETGRIRTIIEGGVMDGKNTAEFLAFLPPDGAVYGFEPLLEVYENGPYRAEVERHPNCRIYPFALWERRQRLLFEIDPANIAGGKVFPEGDVGGRRRPVEAVAVDEFVEEHRVGRVDYLKLDIEGAEPEALRGARQVLRRDRPQVAVCIYHRKEHLVEIPLLLAELLPDCVHRLGHYSCSFWDTVWYALPRSPR